jgi:hypothetical protein
MDQLLFPATAALVAIVKLNHRKILQRKRKPVLLPQQRHLERMLVAQTQLNRHAHYLITRLET